MEIRPFIEHRARPGSIHARPDGLLYPAEDSEEYTDASGNEGTSAYDGVSAQTGRRGRRGTHWPTLCGRREKINYSSALRPTL